MLPPELFLASVRTEDQSATMEKTEEEAAREIVMGARFDCRKPPL